MIREERDDTTGWSRFTAQCGDITVQFVPQAGCNVSSVQFRGVELLKQAPSLAELRGFRYGVPILYPSPGRIADGRFVFENQTFCFPADRELGVLHGIACLAEWQIMHAEAEGSESVLIRCRLPFEPGSTLYDWFPRVHELIVTLRVANNGIRWDYEVDNSAGREAIPFGIGLHPWFLYHGEREQTWLHLHASEKEVLDDGMAVGRREALSPSAAAAAPAICLGAEPMDDVFCGLAHDRMTSVEFRRANLMLSLRASHDFTHLVVYSPPKESCFCVENWTSAPDAHNLFARGLKNQSGLQVVQPGRQCSGWIELHVADNTT